MKFFRFEQQRADIIGRAILPRGTLGGTCDSCDLGAEMARQFSLTPWWSAILTRLGIALVWYAPFFLLGRFGTFAKLGLDEKHKLLDRFARSKNYWLREIAMILKMNACTAGMANAETMTYLGAYDFGRAPAAAPVLLGRSGT